MFGYQRGYARGHAEGLAEGCRLAKNGIDEMSATAQQQIEKLGRAAKGAEDVYKRALDGLMSRYDELLKEHKELVARIGG